MYVMILISHYLYPQPPFNWSSGIKGCSPEQCIILTFNLPGKKKGETGL